MVAAFGLSKSCSSARFSPKNRPPPWAAMNPALTAPIGDPRVNGDMGVIWAQGWKTALDGIERPSDSAGLSSTANQSLAGVPVLPQLVEA